MEPKITIEISKRLFEKIQGLMDEQDFTSVDEYVEFVMNEFTGECEEKQEKPDISEAEERIIKERLRSLGYLE